MSKISELSLTKIVNGIKKKDFTSEEVTKSFIDNSKKSRKLNTYITECFNEALKIERQVNMISLNEIKINEIKKIASSIFESSNNDI